MGSHALKANKGPGEETDDRDPVVGGGGIQEKLMKLSTILQEQGRCEARGSSSDNHRVSDTRGQKSKQELMQLDEVEVVDEEVHRPSKWTAHLLPTQPSHELLLFRPTPWEEGGLQQEEQQANGESQPGAG